MMHTPPPDDADSKHETTYGVPPSKPRPDEDRSIAPPSQAPPDEPDAIPSDPSAIDIFALSPLAALDLLIASVESLARERDAGPPTPPSSSPNTPRLQGAHVQCEHREEARILQNHPSESDSHDSPNAHHHHDVPHPDKTPIGSPEAHHEPSHGEAGAVPLIDELSEADEQMQAQYRALARKFYSKAPPPVPVDVYLKRLHTYCPMSPAVYLTAGYYVQRLSGTLSYDVASDGGSSTISRRPSQTPGFALPVTPRTAHRLLLAALRVATKTLEDRNYSHARFAKVGGVNERELARLEVCLAFLLDFELLVQKEGLQDIAKGMGRAWID